jgi:hypothetical protein
MSDLLSDGVTWLAAQQKSSAAQTVTYARNRSSVAVSATIGRASARVELPAGVARVPTDDRDYLILVADLVLDGVAVEPRDGDRITDSAGRVWQVSPIDGEPAARWSDAFGVRWRIHTRRVS